MSIYSNRREYKRNELHQDDVNESPFAQLQQWVDEALINGGIDEACAMTVATVSAEGKPSARIVLARKIDESGVVFFTSYESRKGQELSNNPAIAAVFYWGALERQVRLEGACVKTSETESDLYFTSRPFNSRIAAVASKQSSVIDTRVELEDQVQQLQTQYTEADSVPRPNNWGGYRIEPVTFEFWQGRPSRLHDRIRYRLINDTWAIDRLSP